MNTETPFEELGLDPRLLTSLGKLGFANASEIQELTFEPILQGKDIFAQAETGSGKTAAFAIPIIQQLLSDDQNIIGTELGAKEAFYIILSPTRELAQQTNKVFNDLGGEAKIVTACIIGGENIEKQKELLFQGVHVVIATPGRLLDLIKQKAFRTEKCRCVVFDEADRLFDMGFKNEIEAILDKIPKTRQIIMLSATTNEEVLRTAYKYHSDPLELRVNMKSIMVEQIDHRLAMVGDNEKFALLVNILRSQEDHYALIFCNTQFQTHVVAEWLLAMGFKARPISGRLPQNKRTKLLQDFRDKKTTVLVCTDVAARGLDIDSVSLVVNYDLPQDAASYVHRIGRTGRAGKSGLAVSFCAYADCEFLDPIYKFINGTIPKMELEDSNFAKDLCKRPYIDRKTLQISEEDTRPNTKRTSERPSEKPERSKRPERGERPARPAPRSDRDGNRDGNEDQTTGKSTMRSSQNTSDRNSQGPKRPPLARDQANGSMANGKFQRSERPDHANNNSNSHDDENDNELNTAATSTEAASAPRTRNDKRVLEIASYDFESAKQKAMLHLPQVEEGLIAHDIVSEGKKKFLLFGPRLINYRFTIRPIFKRLLRPFLGDIIAHGQFALYSKVSYREPVVRISFSGDDTPLLLKNDKEMLKAFEHLIKLYLSQRIILPRSFRVQMDCFKVPQDQEQMLKDLAEKMKQKVVETSEAILLKPLSPADRRIVHQHLDGDEKVSTSSVGDGKFKQIRIKLKV